MEKGNVPGGGKKALFCGVSEKPCSDFASCFVFLPGFGEMKKVTIGNPDDRGAIYDF